MLRFDHPGPTVRQVSAELDGAFLLSVLCKLTYEFDRNGRLVLAAEQEPLVEDIVSDSENPELVLHDTDLYPVKPLCDVVVHGNAHPTHATGRFEVAVAVGPAIKRIAVFGRRRVAKTRQGGLRIGIPEPIEQPVPLRSDHAYGGQDAVAAREMDDPMAHLAPFMDAPAISASLYTYPRNAAGRGYLVRASDAAVEALQMPSLEDPQDLLTEANLVVGDWDRWPQAPLPAALGWTCPGDFPRVGYFGLIPAYCASLSGRVWPEVRRGFAPAQLLAPEPPDAKMNPRAANGAPLGLALADIRGDEEVVLVGMRPRGTCRFMLPRQRPKIWVDGREGRLLETTPVLHTVEIDVERGRVKLLWRGSAPARRPYHDEELQRMPLQVHIK